MSVTFSVTCGKCNESLPTEWAHSAIENPCINCGALEKNVAMNIVEEANFEVHDKLKGKVIDDSFPSKKKKRVEFQAGEDIRKSDGKYMKKQRVIDKDNNRYFEEVIDPETGEVVHRREEPLSDHVGHGSAKK